MLLTMKKMIRFGWYNVRYVVLSIMNFVIPKLKDQIFLYDKEYKKDNVWAIKEHLSRNPKYSNYKVYYYTVKKLDSKENVYYISNPLKALWMQLRSSYVFYSHESIKKMSPNKNQVIINTMHGSPLKNIGYLSGNSKFKKLWRYEKDFTYILCVSDFFKEIIKKGFGASEEQCLVLGYPRNDYIFSQRQVLAFIGVDVKKYSKVVLWMPTWRGNQTTGKNSESSIDFPILNEKNIDHFNEFLKKENILVLLKPHPIQKNLKIFSKNQSNIKLVSDSLLDQKNIFLYEILNEVDALITDYSSIYFDFLLTMKPIAFTIEDIESYGKKRGFVVDNPLKIMPGDKLYNMEDLERFFVDIKLGNDRYYEERKAINDLANKYKDNRSTERIFDKIGIK